MDSSELRELSSRKISVAVLIWIILIFLMFAVNQCSRNNQLKREVSKMRKELKTDYEERIKKRELIIQGLQKDNQLNKNQIDDRRADVLIEEHNLILEFQHSKINIKEVNDRANDYNFHNKKIIWIIDGNNSIKVTKLNFIPNIEIVHIRIWCWWFPRTCLFV